LQNKHVKLLKLNEMKKVLLFFVVALALASCAPKAAETTPAVDSTTVKVDSTVAVVDSAAVVDSTKAVK
jgi:PBP1b-binding outer membrane lipoprotein LpoB